MDNGILDRIVAYKREEVARLQRRTPGIAWQRPSGERRSLYAALARPGHSGINIIAEIKRASPSAGTIAPRLDPARLARAYARGGAAALSVLTDRRFFGGCAEDLRQARVATDLPVLRKEFIVSAWQLYETAAMGADAVLLITRILEDSQLSDFLRLCGELALDPLVEVDSASELERAARAGALLVGINNRDLTSFVTDTRRALSLARLLSPGQVAVAASGIRGRADVTAALSGGIFNLLVGEHLVRSPDPAAAVAALLGNPPPPRPDGEDLHASA